MCRNLLLIVMTTGVISAQASTHVHPVAAELKPSAVTAAVQPLDSSERNKVHALYSTSTAVKASPKPSPTLNAEPDSGWKYLTTLLTTLVLIGVIAARRYSAESP